ncbi:aspartate-alanine antiporter [uncultured Cloacibacillus sp.]|nr:aspartate-alanine antiporter [uncultured Cloacibacillus sp.]
MKGESFPMEIIYQLAAICRENPSIPFFFCIGAGYWLGSFKYKGVALGAVAATLIVAVIVGALMGVVISPNVKNIFFLLFIFTIGYSSGPAFFHSLRSSALPLLAFALLMAVLCLASAYVMAKLMGLNPGFGAGLLAGSATESLMIGVATDTIAKLGLGPALTAQYVNDVPIAYAISYLFGTIGAIWITAYLGPILLGVKDIRAEARALESKLGETKMPPDTFIEYTDYLTRSYRVENPRYIGRSVGAAEAAEGGDKSFLITALRRQGEKISVTDETTLEKDDVVAVRSLRRILADTAAMPGPEVVDNELSSLVMERVSVVVTKREWFGKTVEELAVEPQMHGVIISKITRGVQEIPVYNSTVIHRGDVVTIGGVMKAVELAIPTIGYPERTSTATDMVTVALGIAAGTIVGALTLKVGRIPLSLTTGGGALLAGLLISWFRSTRPVFGNMPAATSWLFQSLGLCGFIAVVGLSCGPDFVSGLRQNGWGIMWGGIVVTVVPIVSCILAGKWFFKMNPVILLGACTGARLCTAALGALQEACGSPTPVLGYTVPYALNNIIFAVWGVVIVLLMA